MIARSMIPRVAMTAVLLVGAVSRAGAQSAQPWSIAGSLLGANQDLNGSLVGGIGFEGQLRYTPASLWSLGLGFQTSTHSSGGETLTLSGVFLEPRYALDIGSDRFAPYLAGRAALLHESSTLKLAGSVSSNGGAFGAGAGLLIRATKSINIDLGAAIVQQSFGDAAGANGTTVKFKSFTGYVAKGGISFGFGGK